MGFESQGSDALSGVSPGGFEFGIQGWAWGEPKPTSITFFLDNTASVCDQYGRYIRRAVRADGTEVKFADSPPSANKEGDVYPRPQFATHAEVIQALAEERINWLAYRVNYRGRDNRQQFRGGLSLKDAVAMQTKLLRDGLTDVVIMREIVSAGWPQLPYEELKKLPEVPPTPGSDLIKILDNDLRKAALRLRRETDEAYNNQRDQSREV